jgi:hypothetical protein
MFRRGPARVGSDGNRTGTGYAYSLAVAQLHPDSEETLQNLIDAGETVERASRRFSTFAVDNADYLILSGPGLGGNKGVPPQDLLELDEAGFLTYTERRNHGTGDFFVNTRGEEHAREVRSRGEPLMRVEEEVERYMKPEGFRRRHADAYAKWRQAAEYAADDPVEHASRIGHDCREALIAFATSFADVHQVTPEGKGTYRAIEAVIDAHEDDLGERTAALLRSLFELWKAASGLAQRQEHAESRDEPLTPDDGRRCVFYTGLVMHELDRTLPA